MDSTWDDFKNAATLGTPSRVPVALIVDSPWLPGWAGIDTRDYFLYPDKWLEVNKELRSRFPSAVWIPGFWVEFGMAAEPSAFGARIRFYHNQPPAIEPLHANLEFWAQAKPINPLEDGLMPLVLRLYQQMDKLLSVEGTPIRMVAARGPLTVASWLVGISPLMEGLALNPDEANQLLETVTTSLIRWLEAQLDCLSQPEGILLLDDLVGMVSPRTYKKQIEPHLQRIFSAFDGLIRIYHNDTPCPHLLEPLSEAGFEVFNFSHKTDISEVKEKMGQNVALMGNVAPLDLGVRGTPGEVYTAAMNCLERAAPGGGVILSFGGGVSPGTPPENIDALLQAAQDYNDESK